MKSKSHFVLLSLLALLFAGTRCALAAAPLTQPAEKFPLPIIVVEGTATQMGDSQGKQLKSAITLLFDKYLKVYLGSPSRRILAMLAANNFELKILPAHLEEIHALGAQVGLEPGEAVLAQCFLDLSAMSACSTITLPAAAAPDHVARFGRNLDFPALNIADKYTTILIYRPSDGRYQFLSVGWPGMIGVLSGMNEYGLCLANMEVKREPRVPTAMPYTLLYRMVLERCKTVDEAVALLQKTPIQTANNLMLMDAAGNRAVVELTPAKITVRQGADGAALLSTNHQRGADADTAGYCDRYDFLHDTAKQQFGKIDVDEVKKLLVGASQGNFTLQSMIFEPANRVIYISAGHNAARGTFHRLDVKKYFEAK